MAKQNLPTNYQDDIMNASMNGKRRYNLIPNADGTYSLEDATVYDKVGSEFGAGNVNAICTAVNASADKSKIIESLDDVEANTQSGMIAGAMALKQVNSNLIISDTIIGTNKKIISKGDSEYRFTYTVPTGKHIVCIWVYSNENNLIIGSPRYTGTEIIGHLINTASSDISFLLSANILLSANN